MDREKFYEICRSYGQDRFLESLERLSEEELREVLDKADLLNMQMLGSVRDAQQAPERGLVTPIDTMTIDDRSKDEKRFREIGLEAIRSGRIGAVLLAGGMGTRLGFDHAKGMYDIGLTHEVFIFQRLIENLLDVVHEAGCMIRLFVMTSWLNDRETREFFRDHDYFGYDPEYISFYMQDMSPCLDDELNMMLESRERIAMSPNGNGGFYTSLISAGLDKLIEREGIEFLNIFAVDNVLQRIADPVFIGAFLDGGYVTGAKVVPKASPDEKVGVMCLEDGAPSVIEYYDMTDEQKSITDMNGKLLFNYGVILNYLFTVSAIDKLTRTDLPVHLVRKKIPYLAEDGSTVTPALPNGYKLETLVLDMVHMAGTCLPFEVERKHEFAPIKNATGIDSVESARRMLAEEGFEL